MLLPKDHIRLIIILPKRDDGIVRCQTSVCPLGPELKYTALSYTWGNPARPPDGHTIEIDGHQKLIRKNLWRFLCQISHASRLWTDLLWIDSISINQDNTEEKAQQIAMMGRIFQTARSVIVWLGPAYNESDIAMDLLKRHESLSLRKVKQVRFWSERGGVALARLCNRAYWTRLWVFQELMLAKKILIMCGDKKVQWDAFHKVMSPLLDIDAGMKPREDREALVPSDEAAQPETHSRPNCTDRRNGDIQTVMRCPAVAMVRQRHATTASGNSLYDLMGATQALNCANVRDRIFALLGVASADSTVGIVVDYATPLRVLLNVVLRNFHLEQKPKSTHEVHLQCNELSRWLGQSPELIFELGGRRDAVAFPQIGRPDCPIGEVYRDGISLWWTLCYGHYNLHHLLLKTHHEPAEILGKVWEWAWKYNERSVLTTMVSTGMVPGKWCGPALLVARYRRDPALCALLLQHESQCIPAEDLMSTCRHACYHGYKEVLKLCLSHNLHARHINEGFVTACTRGHANLVGLLLDHGADIHSLNESGEDMLIFACGMLRYRGFETVAKILIFRSMKENVGVHSLNLAHALRAACTNENQSSRRWAYNLDFCRSKQEYAEAIVDGGPDRIIPLLLAGGADVYVKGDRGGNALQAACACRSEGVVRLLLECGADVHAPSLDGSPGGALYAASQYGREQIVRLLLDYGANEFAPALKVAIILRKEAIVRELLLRGANPNEQYGDNGTALQFACAKGEVAIVRLLLEHGADICLKSERYKDALHAAKQHKAVMDVLLAARTIKPSVGRTISSFIKSRLP